jgi:hypothetical protein
MAFRRKNPETELCNHIKTALNKLPGVRCWRNSVMSGYMASGRFASAGLGKGSSDFLVCCQGLFLALEVKMPGKQAEEHQLEWGKEVESAGGTYVVVHSIQEALDAVQRLTQKNKALSLSCGRHKSEKLPNSRTRVD